MKLLNNKKGFTLLEVMVGVVMLMVTIVALAGVTGYLTDLSETAREKTIVSAHMNRIMEKSRSLADTSLASVATFTWSDWFTQQTQTSRDTSLYYDHPFTLFSGETLGTSFSGTDPVTATFTISWTHKGGRTLSMSMVTILTDRV